MKSNLFFIIGIRRSGTSLLRELIMKHPQVMGCEFEPHDLWAAVDLNHFPRLIKKHNVSKFVTSTINKFIENGQIAHARGKWYGAKFALNPGVKALEWIWLKKTFPDAKFIFITRDINSTWRSYENQDKNSIRGLISKEAYCIEAQRLINNFAKNKTSDISINPYERLLRDPDRTMCDYFMSLGLPMPNIDFIPHIKQPEF